MASSFVSIEGILYARVPATELLADQVDIPAVMVLPPEAGLKVILPEEALDQLGVVTELPPVVLTSTQIGDEATGVNPLTGATGILGWLSSIFGRIILPSALGDDSSFKVAPGSAWERLLSSPDLVQTFAYLDAGDPANERVGSITYTSSSKSLTVVETYTYVGSAGAYRVNTITRSQS
jgi:hypothetical protein